MWLTPEKPLSGAGVLMAEWPSSPWAIVYDCDLPASERGNRNSAKGSGEECNKVKQICDCAAAERAGPTPEICTIKGQQKGGVSVQSGFAVRMWRKQTLENQRGDGWVTGISE